MHKDDIHQLVKGGEKMKKRINCTHQHHHHHLQQLRRRRRCRRRIKCALESLSKISFLYSFLFKPLLSFVQLYCAFDVDDHVYDFQKSIHRFQIDCLNTNIHIKYSKHVCNLLDLRIWNVIRYLLIIIRAYIRFPIILYK